jgi:hypothetical protein
MARISTYTADSALVSSDKLIGTDSSGATTKNYPLGTVADWLKESGASAVLGQTNYKFQIALDPNEGREPGSFSFSNYGGDGTEFIDVSRLVVSNLSSTGQYIGDYLLSTVGDRVMLAQLEDLNNFGVYRLVSLIENPVEPTFFNAELLFVEGNGALQGNKSYGLATYSASASAGSAIWGSIEGDVTNQTDLVEYIDAEIGAIPASTLQTVTDEGNTTTNDITVNSVVANGTLQLSAYTAGLLQTDASGNVSLDTTSYSTFSGNYDDLTDKPYIPVSGTDFDPVGTDNSTNVTLNTSSNDYLSLSGQEITLSQIDYNADIANTPTLGTAAATDSNEYATAEQGATADSALQPGDADLTPSWVPSADPEYLTSVAFSDLTSTPTTIEGYGITDALEIGTTATTALAGDTFIPVSGIDFDPVGTDNSTNVTLLSVTENYLSISGQEITAGIVPISLGGTGAGTAEDARSSLNVDEAGTDNSTNVTLAGTYDYLTLSGQEITLNQIDYSTDISNIPAEDTLDSVTDRGNTTTNNITVNNVVASANVTSSNNYLIIDSTDNDRAVMLLDGTNNLVLQTGTSSGSRGILFNAEGAERMRIAHTGNVGIGTTAPGAKLDVQGQIHIYDNGNVSYVESQNQPLYLASAADLRINAQQTGGDIYLDANGFIKFREAGADVMAIDDGNVGIGTTSPNANLEIGAAVNVAPNLRLTLNDSGNSINAGQEYAGIQWSGNDGQGDGVRADIRVFGEGTSGQTYMAFGTMPAGTSSSTSAIERMRITSGGNVGIGTTTPDAVLDITGSYASNAVRIQNTDASYYSSIGFIESSGTLKAAVGVGNSSAPSTYADNAYVYTVGGSDFVIATGTSEKARVTSDGKVGIGTTSPGDKLHVLSSTNTVARFETSLTSDMAIELKNSQGSMFFGLGGGEEFAIGTDADLNGANSKFVVKPSGNVGIGTTSPSSKLDVNGDIAIKGNPIINRTGNALTIGDIDNTDSVGNISIDSADGSTIVLLDDNGHVGFNETSPNSAVDINGTAMEQLRLRTPGGPSSNSDTSGREGDFAYDDLYLYIKTGSGWGRVALDFAF